MWATLETWLLGDGEVPELCIGEVLAHKGLRLSCDTFGPSAETTTGAWTAGAATEGDITHRLRGVVVAAWRQAAVIDIGECLALLEPAAVRSVQTRMVTKRWSGTPPTSRPRPSGRWVKRSVGLKSCPTMSGKHSTSSTCAVTGDSRM